jgi:hypothetical protein
MCLFEKWREKQRGWLGEGQWQAADWYFAVVVIILTDSSSAMECTRFFGSPKSSSCSIAMLLRVLSVFCSVSSAILSIDVGMCLFDCQQ